MWMGKIANTGYGVCWDKEKKKAVSTHRFFYEAFVGPLTKGLEIDHLCRHRWCCNPSHLEQVTTLENGKRSPISKTGGKPFCLRGHAMIPGNYYVSRKTNGYLRRQCKECQKICEEKRRDKRLERRRQRWAERRLEK